MRRVTAGLGSLAIAAGVTTTLALTATAAPPDGSKPIAAKKAAVDELPNPAEEKRRALREVALRKVLAGQAKVQKRGASTVVKVSKGSSAKNGAKASQVPDDQYVELAREKTDKIFVVLAEFGNERQPSVPGPGHGSGHPGPDHVRRPAAQQDPGAGPLEGQLDGLAAGLQRAALPRHVLRLRRGLAQDATTRSSHRAATASTARSPTG